ncbi:serine acetyltransferase [Limosilactobacillus pontis]|uniref:Serine acetyltransferase n=1 Tax=Limosilactobacillus pontis TaxID=35787 RepID=A0ABU7SUT0_9LACO
MEISNDKKGNLIVRIICFGKKYYKQRNLFEKVAYRIYKVINFLFIIIVFSSEIHVSDKISSKLIFYHPYGIVIHGNCKIGDYCVIRQQVTIGNKGINDDGCPIIGNNVEIGAGAKIIGNVSIGDNSKIGANAVVTKSFPNNSILVGVPARNIAKD